MPSSISWADGAGPLGNAASGAITAARASRTKVRFFTGAPPIDGVRRILPRRGHRGGSVLAREAALCAGEHRSSDAGVPATRADELIELDVLIDDVGEFFV